MKNETEAKGKEEKRFLWVKENNVGSKMRQIKSILNMFLSYAFEQMQMSDYAKFPSECISLIELLNENMDSLEMEIDEALLFVKRKLNSDVSL